MNGEKLSHQEKFIGILKAQVPKNISLADEIASLLDISLDSAYRRLRGETELTLDETISLCHHFNVPFENLNQEVDTAVTFRFNRLENTVDSFKEYLESLLGNLRHIGQMDQKHIYFAAEDIPIFHHFKYPNLSAFKFLYWMKSIQNTEGMEHQKFSRDLISPELIDTGRKSYNVYASIPGTEIWSDETIISTLKQIRFYWDAGFFLLREDAMEICNEIRQVIEDIQKQTESGYKISAEGNGTAASFTFYASDLMIGTNCVLVQAGERKLSYLSYHTFNTMHTSNYYFNEQNEKWMNNLIRKSTLLSSVAEKQRNQFFKGLYKRISELEEYVRVSD
jgi:hypothetical protein